MKNDELGERIKSQYENRTRYFLPRRTYTILRIDGKAFHTYTKHLKKPFDHDLADDLDRAVIDSLSEIQGAQFAYCQSDEISILLTDFAKPTTSAWFDGNIQKICSVSASLISSNFNKNRIERLSKKYLARCKKENGCNFDAIWEESIDSIREEVANFDCRAFTIPDRIEVMNYFRWRNQDCSRNSISMVAQANFSHKELQGKSSAEMQEMLFKQKGINWADLPPADKDGRVIVKEEYVVTKKDDFPEVIRSRWVAKPAWKFTQNETILDMIPNY